MRTSAVKKPMTKAKAQMPPTPYPMSSSVWTLSGQISNLKMASSTRLSATATAPNATAST